MIIAIKAKKVVPILVFSFALAAVLLTYGFRSVTVANCDWGLNFSEENSPPRGNETAENLKKSNAYYIGDTEKKNIYLTFDAGYENGYTPSILDTLKKHNVKATFFVVGNYITSAPDLVKRMNDEGHTVGNHTYHHPDMSSISEESAFREEICSLEDEYKKVTGCEMIKYYRPPRGKYSEENLEMAKKLGYKTFFWSLAYVDWNQDSQPTHEEAIQKLTSRIHNGAIVLLHSTSSTNAEILDQLLTKWEDMGYKIKPLSELG